MGHTFSVIVLKVEVDAIVKEERRRNNFAYEQSRIKLILKLHKVLKWSALHKVVKVLQNWRCPKNHPPNWSEGREVKSAVIKEHIGTKCWISKEVKAPVFSTFAISDGNFLFGNLMLFFSKSPKTFLMNRQFQQLIPFLRHSENQIWLRILFKAFYLYVPSVLCWNYF